MDNHKTSDAPTRLLLEEAYKQMRAAHVALQEFALAQQEQVRAQLATSETALRMVRYVADEMTSQLPAQTD